MQNRKPVRRIKSRSRLHHSLDTGHGDRSLTAWLGRDRLKMSFQLLQEIHIQRMVSQIQDRQMNLVLRRSRDGQG